MTAVWPSDGASGNRTGPTGVDKGERTNQVNDGIR
jgi:hypothetical protein